MRRLTGLFLILFVMAGVVTAGEWITEVVDDTAAVQVGFYTSTVLDSSGYPHISYYAKLDVYDLKYARWDGSAWQIETVDSEGKVGGQSSLELDASGNPHISYRDYDNQSLKYAHWDGSAWQIETVDSTGPVGAYSSLELDSSGNPHISYNEYVNHDLKYTYWDGSAWQIETVDSTGWVGDFVSLGLDLSDNAHIAYYDHTNGALKYAHRDGSAWQIATVDSAVDAGWGNSLVLDSSDYPHIAYHVNGVYYMKYAYWDGSAWQVELVDGGNGDVCGAYQNPLALDSSGNPHISYYWYYDNQNNGLRYARKDGSGWQLSMVDTDPQAGSYSSLALDSTGNPHISYHDGHNRDLKYAYWNGGVAVESVDLSAQPTDEGVLLIWSIVGDEPATVSVLRGLTQNGSVSQNDTVDLSGALTGSATSWLDVSGSAGVEYAYYLEITELDGTVSRFGPSEVVVPGAASELTLSDPYPNPASSSLTISYELAAKGAVSLSVYDLSGRLVETLISGEQTAGRHSVIWDSSVAATGVYLLRLEAAGEAITRRAIISR
ncbi:T9SS type A sorting domain-containing protein [bacterium]|nr:T9SS type A sorting domain-containing protein [bacterium]